MVEAILLFSENIGYNLVQKGATMVRCFLFLISVIIFILFFDLLKFELLKCFYLVTVDFTVKLTFLLFFGG